MVDERRPVKNTLGITGVLPSHRETRGIFLNTGKRSAGLAGRALRHLDCKNVALIT